MSLRSYRVKRIQRLSAVARFSQPAQGFNTRCVGDLLYHIAKTYFLFFDKTRETNAMRLAFSFTCWFFLLLGAHGLANSIYCSAVYPLLSMNW